MNGLENADTTLTVVYFIEIVTWCLIMKLINHYACKWYLSCFEHMSIVLSVVCILEWNYEVTVA